MLSRYQIRIKVFHCLYATSISDNLEQEWKTCFDSYLDLYNFYLKILVFVKKRAELEIDLGLNKKKPNYLDLNPNKKFANNLILDKIEKELYNESFHEEHLKLLSKNILSNIKEKEYFKKYMELEKNKIEDDQKIITKILKKDILSNDKIIELLEEKSIYWNDDITSAYNLFIHKSSKKNIIEKDYKFTKTSIFKNKIDEQFAKVLFFKTVELKEKINEQIFNLAENWDLERISNSDLALLQLAITEIIEFEDIPKKVTINEYIKISKEYCSPKSYEFINGILDSFIKKNVNLKS
tara:strand:- start:267 stop:1151 length:885 start_codon:yes stop_codon:yes gene_type:complete